MPPGPPTTIWRTITKKNLFLSRLSKKIIHSNHHKTMHLLQKHVIPSIVNLEERIINLEKRIESISGNTVTCSDTQHSNDCVKLDQ